MTEEKVNQVITALKEISLDNTIPKSILVKVQTTIKFLESNEDTSIKVSKALGEIEELTLNNNMESITRTQLFNIASILEIIS